MRISFPLWKKQSVEREYFRLPLHCPLATSCAVSRAASIVFSAIAVSCAAGLDRRQIRGRRGRYESSSEATRFEDPTLRTRERNGCHCFGSFAQLSGVVEFPGRGNPLTYISLRTPCGRETQERCAKGECSALGLRNYGKEKEGEDARQPLPAYLGGKIGADEKKKKGCTEKT